MSKLLSPSPVSRRLQRLRHRADDRHLEPVEDPDGAEADHDHPVPPRPRQPVEPGRDVGGDASCLCSHDGPRTHARIGAMSDVTRLETQRLIAAPAADIFAAALRPAGPRRGRLLRDAPGRHRRPGDRGRRQLRRPHGPGVAQRLPGDGQVRRHRDHPRLRGRPADLVDDPRPDPARRSATSTATASSRTPTGSDGTLVTSFYDWSDIHPDWQAAGIFPVISENALRASLGILDRTVRRGYPRLGRIRVRVLAQSLRWAESGVSGSGQHGEDPFGVIAELLHEAGQERTSSRAR